MTYKYKKIVTQGANGTSLMHKSTEENPIFNLGEIDGFIYIKADVLVEQHEQLDFIEVALSDVEKQELRKQSHLHIAKLNARNRIRKIKDFEDDLTDLKQLVQFMGRGFAGLWVSLPAELKQDNIYKDNFDLFSNAILNTEFRLDLELDQTAKMVDIINDEVEFADIAKKEYLDLLR